MAKLKILMLICITTVTLQSCKVQYNNSSYEEVRNELLTEEFSLFHQDPVLAVKGNEELSEEILGTLMYYGHGSPSNLTDTSDSNWVSIITTAGDIISLPKEEVDSALINIVSYEELISLIKMGY